MVTYKVSAKIDQSGNLKIELPVGLPAGTAEVLVVVQPSAATPAATSHAVAGNARSGLFLGKLNGDVDIDSVLNELNQAWKDKLTS